MDSDTSTAYEIIREELSRLQLSGSLSERLYVLDKIILGEHIPRPWFFSSKKSKRLWSLYQNYKYYSPYRAEKAYIIIGRNILRDLYEY